MKRWALLVVLVYLVMLVVCSLPVLFLALGADTDLLVAYETPVVWAWFAAMALGEALLLVLPVGVAERRPKPRRRLWVPVVTCVLLMWLLMACAAGSVWFAIFTDQAEVDGQIMWRVVSSGTLAVWLFWGLIFMRFRRSTAPSALTARLMRWVLGGSILELLVAVPSHIIVRNRGDCCAPAFTFAGIATGLAVMAMSFGPGVFWLYVERMERLRRQRKLCEKCGYDLRASTGRCPECGTSFVEAGA